jgi:hypothetical protein
MQNLFGGLAEEISNVMVRLAAFTTALALTLVFGAAWPRTSTALTNGKPAADFAADNWVNSKPLTVASLRGRVVLVEFWTYG